MKKEELRRLFIEEKYLKYWTNGTYVSKTKESKWSWNEDGSVDIEGDVIIQCDIPSKYPYTLPVKIRKVSGIFWFKSVTQLKTLDDCPLEYGSFYLDGYIIDFNKEFAENYKRGKIDRKSK